MNQSWRRFRPSTQIIPKSWREKISFNFQFLLILLALLLLSAGAYFGYRYYLDNTIVVPSVGGTLIEGVAGQPKYINPILSQTNDVDRDLAGLIFSGLLKFDEDRNLIGDLAEKWELSEDEKGYTVYLKEGISWHDGESFDADDVVFTYQMIQNDLYPGTLHNNWRDVTVEKIDEKTIKFSLTEVFSPFLVNLTTGVLPQHLLSGVTPNQLDSDDFNIRPIGTGPYKLDTIQYDRLNEKFNSLELVSNDSYFGEKPYITSIIFRFYDDYQQLYRAYNTKEVNSMSRVLTADWPMVSNTTANVHYYDIALPQYSALFINQDGKELLRDPYVKEAMAYSLNREEIVSNVLLEKGKVINTPIPEGFLGHNPDILHIYQDVDKSKALLSTGKWEDIDEDGILEKDGTRLSIRLVTSDNPEFALAANMIKKFWEDVGITVELVTYNIGDLESQIIQTRNYDVLLFGENLGLDPDPYPYWHSTQSSHPGLNLSQYTSIEIDKYLETGRKTNDNDTRIHSYLPFQEVVFEDKPAIFLTQPYYIYAVNPSVQGVNVDHASSPSDRFQFIRDWFINTKREWKNDDNSDAEVADTNDSIEVTEVLETE